MQKQTLSRFGLLRTLWCKIQSLFGGRRSAVDQLEDLKSDFITLASHQLRTPLSSVQWYLELLSADEERTLTEVQQSYLVEVRMAMHRLGNIITELLDAARLGDGQIEPQRVEISVADRVAELLKEMSPSIHKRDIRYHLSLPSTPITVTTDPKLFNLVIQNIMSNAIKYSMEGGEVIIEIASNQGMAEISVSDKGIGIPVADQERIFEKLFRASNAQDIDTTGSGIGLYSSTKVLDVLGGSLSFESTEGVGSTFTVKIPL